MEIFLPSYWSEALNYCNFSKPLANTWRTSLIIKLKAFTQQTYQWTASRWSFPLFRYTYFKEHCSMAASISCVIFVCRHAINSTLKSLYLSFRCVLMHAHVMHKNEKNATDIIVSNTGGSNFRINSDTFTIMESLFCFSFSQGHFMQKINWISFQ